MKPDQPIGWACASARRTGRRRICPRYASRQKVGGGFGISHRKVSEDRVPSS